MPSSKFLMLLLFFTFSKHVIAQKNKVESWKNEALKAIDGKQKTAQEMVDMVFSFSELGFQEIETSAYNSSGSDSTVLKPAIISAAKIKPVIIWQPSHQTNTGKDFSEAGVCNAIVEAAMKTKPYLKEHKVWSLGRKNLHHADVGSNTIIAQTSAIIDGKISGYAYELKKSNKLSPAVFISVHNNGGTNRHAIWGYIHEGDQFEAENRDLAARLIKAISSVTALENRGVLFDSSTGRNDYYCKTIGKKAFYSLDENINTSSYRVLLEIGDNVISKAFLEDPSNQKKMGEAIKAELIAWLAEKGYKL